MTPRDINNTSLSADPLLALCYFASLSILDPYIIGETATFVLQPHFTDAETEAQRDNVICEGRELSSKAWYRCVRLESHCFRLLSVSLLGTCIQGNCSLLLDLDNPEVLTIGPSNLKQFVFISCFIVFSVLYLYLLILPVPLLQPLSPAPPFAGPLGAGIAAFCPAQEFSGQGLILWFLRKPGRQLGQIMHRPWL